MIYSPYALIAKDVFRIESAAIERLASQLTQDFDVAVDKILETSGRVIICGMGKSGIVGKKISATLASTGTPSFSMHPGEAYHGDLGMVRSEDVFIAISNSGETDEVLKLIPFLRENGNFLIAITGDNKSTLALASGSHLDVCVVEEACPLQLAPTSSTTAALAMGDALAVTLMKVRGFKPENFARFHPGGALGRRLLSRVDDVMHKEQLPYVKKDSPLAEIITVISKGRLGLAIVGDLAEGFAIITDGDLRRAIEMFEDKVFSKTASDLMSHSPVSLPIGTRVEDAYQVMDQSLITAILIVDPKLDNRIVGVLKK